MLCKHGERRTYPYSCDKCRRTADRWSGLGCALAALFIFTAVIPVVPAIVAIILSP